MDALEEEIDLKVPAVENIHEKKKTSSQSPGLRALISIKKFGVTLKEDYTRLLQIENDLKEVNQTGKLILEEHAQPGILENWQLNIKMIEESVAGLKDLLNEAKEKIEKAVPTDFPAMWKQLYIYLIQLKESTEQNEKMGFESLPENIHSKWEKEFQQVEVALVQSMVLHVESCRVLLQMIERYTPDELNKITKLIADQIPSGFTYEEAETYQKDYYAALVNFKKEFKAEKNLWDKFLDILAGGTHQPPSERVMLERWIEGEKGDLE